MIAPVTLFASDLLSTLGALLVLYAEIHYTFRGVYSRLKIREPEIIADVPHRLEPGVPLPILLLVKDAHRFPIELQDVRVRVECGEKKVRKVFPLAQAINSPWWSHVLQWALPPDFSGHCTVNVSLRYTIRGQSKVAHNDNYVGTSHAPFAVYISRWPLPKTSGWCFGEFHSHSNYTSDQVEFGAPLSCTKELAKSLGLRFFCATDHSYDLDDHADDYLRNDPQLKKWERFLQEVTELNRDDPHFVIVPGEEVSAGNHRNRNVHFLILNNPEFLPGDGDSAEKWLRTRPNLAIPAILNRLEPGALSFAAHPAAPPPLLERLLVRRGRWWKQDCAHPKLHGLQIWNGSPDGLEEGRRLWIELLLEGRRIFIAGGNDAHGNFGRFRQIGLPFFTMREHRRQLFGRVRTGVFVKDGSGLQGLLSAVLQGSMVITDGPFVELLVTNERGRTAGIGAALSGAHFEVGVQCLSTPEFGDLRELRLFRGDLSRGEEYLLKRVVDFEAPHEHHETVRLTRHGYVRAELQTSTEGQSRCCLTNPVWLRPK